MMLQNKAIFILLNCVLFGVCERKSKGIKHKKKWDYKLMQNGGGRIMPNLKTDDEDYSENGKHDGEMCITEEKCSSPYGSWSQWSVCRDAFGGGLQIQLRIGSCGVGQVHCFKQECRKCNTDTNCTGEWTPWVMRNDKCNHNCTRFRERTCRSKIEVLHNNFLCNGTTQVEPISCSKDECKAPKNGGTDTIVTDGSEINLLALIISLVAIVVIIFVLLAAFCRSTRLKKRRQNEVNREESSESFILTSWREFSKKWIPRKQTIVTVTTTKSCQEDFEEDPEYQSICEKNEHHYQESSFDMSNDKKKKLEAISYYENFQRPCSHHPCSKFTTNLPSTSSDIDPYQPTFVQRNKVERSETSTSTSSGYNFIGGTGPYTEMRAFKNPNRTKSSNDANLQIHNHDDIGYKRSASEPKNTKIFVSHTRRVSRQVTFRRGGVATRVSKHKWNNSKKKAIKNIQIPLEEDHYGYVIANINNKPCCHTKSTPNFYELSDNIPINDHAYQSFDTSMPYRSNPLPMSAHPSQCNAAHLSLQNN